ncbi:hypothetical protein SLH49_02465 [Cognatiyoonia sp. IB215446]|uniref:hypothetical protein n=1 Tax=Cognatiyoonia sp. IB215446 TaxID=3097355 RepID=UPI002A10C493|nr:hypothetical protein [Cognatiyoonia sp. IB215446]MDX8346839.1 hypothetical protein [Cognatiyoonia sp. IB215446]
MFEPCLETVSILYAIVFGAGDACIEIGTMSILTAFGAFIVLVVIAQYFARMLWRQLTGAGTARPSRRVGTIYDDADDIVEPVETGKRRPGTPGAQSANDGDKFKDSAVWSAKR